MDQSPVEAQGHDMVTPTRAMWRAKPSPNLGSTSPVEAQPVLTIDRSMLTVDRGHMSVTPPCGTHLSEDETTEMMSC